MNGIACAIGSLPHTNPETAVRFILEDFDGIPFWPQLPKRHYFETFYAQYCEGLPACQLDLDQQKLRFLTKSGIDELTNFYENIIAGEIDPFAISKDHAAGLHVLLQTLKGKHLPSIKGHVTGPVTFALSAVGEDGRLLAYDPNFLDVLVKGCIAKAAWQFEQFRAIADEVIIFFDEPGLVGFGSAFVQMSGQQVIEILSEAVRETQQRGAVVGIHCCANTDWSLIFNAGVDILSFDAFEFFDNLLIYRSELIEFYARGGRIAYGIVPTDDKVFSLTPEDLLAILTRQVSAIASLGIDKETVARQSLITPACGLGTVDVPLAQRALKLTSQTALAFRRHYGFK